jgi:hypothetical protein
LADPEIQDAAILVDMHRMTQLTQFIADAVLLEGSVLPQQLRQLQLNEVHTGPQLAVIFPLQQLTALKVGVGTQQQELLQRLAQLPALQQLQLEYQTAEAAAATAPAWAQLPSLCEVCAKLGHTTWQQMAAIVAGLAAATSLTQLTFQLSHAVGMEGQPVQLEAADADADAAGDADGAANVAGVAAGNADAAGDADAAAAGDADGDADAAVAGDAHAAAAGDAAGDADAAVAGEPLAVCSSIARLTRLLRLHLDVCNSPMVHGDALALTALTSLTYLALPNANQGVSDVTAAALASSLTQLHQLDLEACDLAYMACLAAVARLTRLTALSLCHNPGLTEEGLMLLTRLSRLQGLHVDGCEGVDEGVLERFWAAVRSTGG